MDQTSKNMYDTFKDDIWQELGPLDPDWFDVLTSQTFPNEENNPDQDELCANQEKMFKTPFEAAAAAAVESQLFSTPKVFRHHQVVSPEVENGRSFTNKKEKENLPWTTTQSPYLFGVSKEGVQGTKYDAMQPHSEDSFDLLRTPSKSPVNYAKQISESLGAHIHPDISWTSSLNTPPAVPSTLILSNTDESPCPVSNTADKNVVIVRTLFPSLSNASKIGESSPKNNDIPAIEQALVSPEVDHNSESHDSPLSEAGWKQKLPDAIEDKDIRSTVANVLDGAEDVLSIFFSSTSSSLRKVKTERNKRKQIVQKKGRNCSTTERKTDDQDPGKLSLSPMARAVVSGNSQWSPLSLSEIPTCTVDSQCRNETPAPKAQYRILTEKLDTESGHLAKPLLTITDSGLIKKKRKFIYTVDTSKTEIHSPRSPNSGYGMSVGQLGDVEDEMDWSNTKEKEIQKQEPITKESLPSPVHLKAQDIDMSQLCRDFEEDFTQMSELSKLGKVAEDAPQNHFSPSACLSAMKQARIKARQANLYQDCEGFSIRRDLSATNPSFSSNAATVNDSGFQSAVMDITHVPTTSVVFPSSENNSQSQLDYEAYTHRTASKLCTNKGTGNTLLDDNLQETDANLCSAIKESQILDSGTESGLYKESMSTQPPRSAKGTVDNSILLNGQVSAHPEKTIHFLPSISAAGFKTASNKSIEISSTNLDKAKHLFDEIEPEINFMGEAQKNPHNSKGAVRVSHGSEKGHPSKSNQQTSSSEICRNVVSQLTASQKADVTELCTLLEEADSQFEFTQFKAAPHFDENPTSFRKVEKELDSDFLTGIDFDDSFSLDVERQTAKTAMPEESFSVLDSKTKITSKITSASIPRSNAVEKGKSFTEDVSSPFNDISVDNRNIMSAQSKTLDLVDNFEFNQQGNNNVILGEGFKTAGGNVLRVSEKCLSKARALFADLDENLKVKNSLYEQSLEIDDKTEPGQIADITYKGGPKDFKNSNIDTSICGSGFQMASGKRISVSAKALQEADSFFKDCAALDCDPGMSVKHNRSGAQLPESIHHKKSLSEFKNVEIKDSIALPSADTLLGNHSLDANAFSSSQSTLKDASSAISELKNGCGFSTANGKKLAVSADAMKKAENLLNEIHAPGETTKLLKADGAALRTDCINQIQIASTNGGFQTASGKGVVISSAALKEAKSMLGSFEDVDDNTSVKSNMMPFYGLPQKNCGFVAANGKPVTLSSEALQKAKTLFSDIDLSTENPAVSDTRDSGKTQDTYAFSEFSSSNGPDDAVVKAESHLSKSITFEETNEMDTLSKDTLPPQNNTFQTASGKGAPVSLAALKKAKHLLSECSGEPGASSAEALQNAKDLFNDISCSPEVSDRKTSDGRQDNAGKIHCGFMTAGGTKVLVSQRNLLNAKKLLNEFDENPISLEASKPDTNVHPGFAHADFVNVHVRQVTENENALHFDDSTTFGDLNKKETLLPHTSGFQTASGKGVAISSAALKKAKTLLSESEVYSGKIGVKPANCQMQFSDQTPKNCGFNGSNDQPGAHSPEGIQKAKAIFSDIPNVSESTRTNRYDGLQKGKPAMHCGFTTARGARVNVSKKSLVKTKNLWKEFNDGNCHDLNSYSTSPQDTQRSDPAKLHVIQKNSDFKVSGVCDMSNKILDPKECPPFPPLQETGNENETLHVLESSINHFTSMKDEESTYAWKHKDDKGTTSTVDNWQEITAEELANVLDDKINQGISNEAPESASTEHSSFLIYQSLNLSDCSETQRKSLAQEALDCTKALLEDEGHGKLKNVEFQEDPKSSKLSVEEQKGRRKRSLEDTHSDTCQPPLKRRLLDEFERTVDGPRHSLLHPEKNCPKGVMKDRRVFRYSDSLHPNIIQPHSNGKTYVEAKKQKSVPTQNPTPGDTGSELSKMPAYVPPFHKTAKTQTIKYNNVSDNRKTSAFIPPFKKQRTIVQEPSYKAQVEDVQNPPSVTPSKSRTYVPPTKKTHNALALIGTVGQDDSQTGGLADITKNQVTHQNLPADCESEDAVADKQGVEDSMCKDQDMFQDLRNTELARDMQDMRIRKKKRQTIRPLPGSLYLTKTSGLSRISLKAAAQGNPPTRYSQKHLYEYGVQQYVTEITSETAENFRFNLKHFLKREAFRDCGGVQLADGGWLITSNDGTAGKEEFYRALCDTPGVDPKLISEGWVYNHYRWIVWKQASMEISFPETMGSHCLTPEQVLLQLKYRYDVEVDHSRRPALRKIMERDDTAAKTLVLCVCGVVSKGHLQNPNSRSEAKTPKGPDAKGSKVENPSAVIWLTDGWYAIKALLDEPLTAMLHNGRLGIGGKLIIHGAQLVGSQDACSPLEAPESLMLKICANSSRPVRWHTKLGFNRDPRPFLLPVSSLYSNGGPVGCVDIIILRSYPIQWMEKKSDGGVVFRSVRAEEKEARRYNSHKQKAMEILFAKIQDEFEKEDKGNNKSQHRRRTISPQDIATLQDGEELYEAVGDDLAYLEAHLTERQLETLSTYRRSLIEKKQAELQDRYRRALEAEEGEGSCLKRDITPVWRLCVADSIDQSGKVYQLNLWRPSSDLQSLLKEGCRYKVFNLSTSDGKKRSGMESIQLTGTNKTQFQDLQSSQEWLSTRFQPRVSTSFVDLQNPEFQSLCGEVDLTACVINIIEPQGSSPAFYLVDGKLNFVKVRCFNSFSESGLEDVVKPRVLLALSNLQLRGQSNFPAPVVYAGDLTVFSTNPKEVHLQDSLRELKNLIQGHENFYLEAEEKLFHLIRSDGLSTIFTPVQPLKSLACITERRQDTNKSAVSQHPVRSIGSFTPVNRNPPTAATSVERDPRSLKRRRALDYLSRIPSPPGLSYLSSAASPCVKKTFNPPRRSGTPSTLKAEQTPACRPVSSLVEDEWVNDEELAMIDTQALLGTSVDTLHCKH